MAYRVRIISQLVEQAHHVQATYSNLRKITANPGWLLADNTLRLMAAGQASGSGRLYTFWAVKE